MDDISINVFVKLLENFMRFDKRNYFLARN